MSSVNNLEGRLGSCCLHFVYQFPLRMYIHFCRRNPTFFKYQILTRNLHTVKEMSVYRHFMFIIESCKRGGEMNSTLVRMVKIKEAYTFLNLEEIRI